MVTAALTRTILTLDEALALDAPVAHDAWCEAGGCVLCAGTGWRRRRRGKAIARGHVRCACDETVRARLGIDPMPHESLVPVANCWRYIADLRAKPIPWLKPSRAIGEAELRAPFEQWWAAIDFWARGDSRTRPRELRIYADRLRANAAAAADVAAAVAAVAANAAANADVAAAVAAVAANAAAADAADVAADAAATAAAAVANDANDAADAAADAAAAADADAAADAAAAADADAAANAANAAAADAAAADDDADAANAANAANAAAADAAIAAANAAGDGADVANAANAAHAADAADANADAAARAADAATSRLWPPGVRWYLRPRWLLWRQARALLYALAPNPWAPLIDMWRLGVMPLGYVAEDGKAVFGIYVPGGAS